MNKFGAFLTVVFFFLAFPLSHAQTKAGAPTVEECGRQVDSYFSCISKTARKSSFLESAKRGVAYPGVTELQRNLTALKVSCAETFAFLESQCLSPQYRTTQNCTGSFVDLEKVGGHAGILEKKIDTIKGSFIDSDRIGAPFVERLNQLKGQALAIREGIQTGCFRPLETDCQRAIRKIESEIGKGYSGSYKLPSGCIYGYRHPITHQFIEFGPGDKYGYEITIRGGVIQSGQYLASRLATTVKTSLGEFDAEVLDSRSAKLLQTIKPVKGAIDNGVTVRFDPNGAASTYSDMSYENVFIPRGSYWNIYVSKADLPFQSCWRGECKVHFYHVRECALFNLEFKNNYVKSLQAEIGFKRSPINARCEISGPGIAPDQTSVINEINLNEESGEINASVFIPSANDRREEIPLVKNGDYHVSYKCEIAIFRSGKSVWHHRTVKYQGRNVDESFNSDVLPFDAQSRRRGKQSKGIQLTGLLRNLDGKRENCTLKLDVSQGDVSGPFITSPTLLKEATITGAQEFKITEGDYEISGRCSFP